jgi:hypothetical protein
VEDDYQWIIAQLEKVHAQGQQTHQRFLEAQAQHDVEAMNLLNQEHRALATEARALVTQLRAVVDAHFAPFGTRDDR